MFNGVVNVRSDFGIKQISMIFKVKGGFLFGSCGKAR